MVVNMKKMKTLFIREFKNHKIVHISSHVTEGCEWVLHNEGIATQKLDGTCCMVKDGKLYARFDSKPGRTLPLGAIPCQEECDSITGHFPHWVPVTADNMYKWHRLAFSRQLGLENGTYELIGQHFQNNPEHIENGDILVRHGSIVLPDVPRSFEGIKKYLNDHLVEGIVFHRENGDMCKIKRTDFDFAWNGKISKAR